MCRGFLRDLAQERSIFPSLLPSHSLFFQQPLAVSYGVAVIPPLGSLRSGYVIWDMLAFLDKTEDGKDGSFLGHLESNAQLQLSYTAHPILESPAIITGYKRQQTEGINLPLLFNFFYHGHSFHGWASTTFLDLPSRHGHVSCALEVSHHVGWYSHHQHYHHYCIFCMLISHKCHVNVSYLSHKSMSYMHHIQYLLQIMHIKLLLRDYCYFCISFMYTYQGLICDR